MWTPSSGNAPDAGNQVYNSLRERRGWQAADLQGADPMTAPKVPKALNAIADVVLAYRPKPKSKPAKSRKRRARKMETNRE